MDGIGKGLEEVMTFLFLVGLFIGLGFWGIFAGINYLFNDNTIKVKEKLIPTI